MKKILFLATALLLQVAVFAQAKKPIIMVVPSDVYCIEKGFVQKYTSDGQEQQAPDYAKLLQSDRNMRLAITKLGSIMSDRGFPLKDLEQEMKNLQQEAAESAALQSNESGSEVAESPIDKLKRSAKADIILDLDFAISKKGPQSYVTFTLKGLDAYTAKQVAGASGAGKPSTSAAVELLVEEAVINYMDEFNGRLQTHFDEMFKIGREVKVVLKRFKTATFNFETEFELNGEEKEFTDIVDDWMVNNCVQGRFSRVTNTANQITYEQVRIPMTKTNSSGREVGVDSRSFALDLRNVIRKPPFSTDCKIYQRGLGEVWLIVGEK